MRHRRSGFTLIELLVVVSVIAILLMLTLLVAGGLISNARQAATAATLSKIQTLLNARAQAFQRLSMRKGFIQGTPEMKLVKAWGPTVPASTQQIVATKLLQRRYFPQAFLEMNPQYMPNDPNTGKPMLTQPGLASANAASSSAILYDWLTQEFVIGDLAPGADNFTAAEVKTNPSSGLNEFIDAWGNPLRFYRWPTRFFRSQGQVNPRTKLIPPQPVFAVNPPSATDIQNAQIMFATLPVFSGNLASDLNRDPDDPLMECSLNFDSCETVNVTGSAPGPSLHTPQTFHVFLVVSAGPDGRLGMYEPDDIQPNAVPPIYGNLAQPIPGAQDDLTDNIVSLSIKAGGAR